jgi:fructose-1,6-bisphosphatase I
MTNLITIERHILETQVYYPDATGTLTNLLYDIALAAKIIARETTLAGLGRDILGEAGGTNLTGDRQHKLDLFAHDTMFRINDHTGRLCIMASEEFEEPLYIPDQFECGNYVLIYDPLDGSSNVDVNGGVGTIFSIFRKVSGGPRGVLEDCLQPGRDLVAAGYVVYGSSTMMVYSVGYGVNGFTLDPSLGEFLLSHPNIQLPAKPKYYSINHSYDEDYTPGVKKFLAYVRDRDTEHGGLAMRYNGAMVADFHRCLLKGGIYMYPGTLRDSAKPEGKLRLLYENAPLGFIAQQAGGAVSDGDGDLMQIVPTELHQRTPLFIGHKGLVEKAQSFIHAHDAEWLAAYREWRALH